MSIAKPLIEIQLVDLMLPPPWLPPIEDEHRLPKHDAAAASRCDRCASAWPAGRSAAACSAPPWQPNPFRAELPRCVPERPSYPVVPRPVRAALYPDVYVGGLSAYPRTYPKQLTVAELRDKYAIGAITLEELEELLPAALEAEPARIAARPRRAGSFAVGAAIVVVPALAAAAILAVGLAAVLAIALLAPLVVVVLLSRA